MLPVIMPAVQRGHCLWRQQIERPHIAQDDGQDFSRCRRPTTEAASSKLLAVLGLSQRRQWSSVLGLCHQGSVARADPRARSLRFRSWISRFLA